jgi:hypothetical protein
MKPSALIQSLLSVTLALVVSAPAFASTQRSADFTEGSAVGIGLFGLSYDYGLGPVSLGANIGTDLASFNYYGQPALKYNARLLWRVMEMDGLSGGVLAGLQYDPGRPGGRAYLNPDLGFSVAYDFRRFDAPFALRLNVTLGVGSGATNYYPSTPDGSAPDTPTANFFQRLTVGPNTSLELAYMPSDNMEITLGGGTWLGMRLKF